MGSHQLAVMVYTELRAMPPDPQVEGFVGRLLPFFELAENHDGYVGRSGKVVVRSPGVDPAEWDWGSWGPFDDPYWYVGPVGPGRLTAKNLSVWENVESVFRYTYKSDHLEAILLRRDWTVDREFPVTSLTGSTAAQSRR